MHPLGLSARKRFLIGIKMNTRSINRKVIELLTELSDNKEVQVTRNKHVKVSGIFGGKKRIMVLSFSPGTYYQQNATGTLRQFIRSNQLPVNPTDYSL